MTTFFPPYGRPYPNILTETSLTFLSPEARAELRSLTHNYFLAHAARTPVEPQSIAQLLDALATDHTNLANALTDLFASAVNQTTHTPLIHTASLLAIISAHTDRGVADECSSLSLKIRHAAAEKETP